MFQWIADKLWKTFSIWESFKENEVFKFFHFQIDLILLLLCPCQPNGCILTVT